MRDLFSSTSLIIITIGLILLSSLFSLPNIGGVGLYSPFNTSVYFAVTFFVLVTFIRAVYIQFFIWSQPLIYLFILYFLLFILSAVNSNADYRYFISYGYAMFLGVSFVWSIQQYNWTIKLLYQTIQLLLILATIQLLIIFIQLFDTHRIIYYWLEYFPLKFTGRTLGSLQQINMMQTFLAFAVTLSLYWVSFYKSYSNVRFNYYKHIYVFLFVFAASWTIAQSGSRAGLLALLVGVFITSLVLRDKIKFKKIDTWLWFAGLVFGLVIGLFISSDGQVIDKAEKVVSGSSIRWYLYKSSFWMFLESPWFGYGLEGFRQAFVEYSLQNRELIPEGLAEQSLKSYSHPHNEFFYWVLQTGIFGLVSILSFFVWFFFALIKQGKRVFWLTIAIASPLLIQAMFSYPLILSAIHYFLLLFVLFIPFSKSVKTVNFKVPRLIQYLILSLTVLIITFSSQMFISMNKSIFETYYYVQRYFLYEKYPEYESHYFEEASSNIFFKSYVDDEMRLMLKRAFIEKNNYDINQYLVWAENLEYSDERERVVFDWITALFYLRRCEEALYVYNEYYSKNYDDSIYIQYLNPIFERISSKYQ